MQTLYAFRHGLATLAAELVDAYMMSADLTSVEGRAVKASWMVSPPYPYRYAKIKSSSDDPTRTVSEQI